MEGANIRVVSYNCKGLTSSMVDGVGLCDSHDIVLLQELWLLPQSLSTLHEIHDSFYGDGISAVKTEDRLLIARLHGGLALLWSNSLNAQLHITMTS